MSMYPSWSIMSFRPSVLGPANRDRVSDTIQQYLVAVRPFGEFLGLDFAEADQGSIRRLVARLQGQPLGPERLRCNTRHSSVRRHPKLTPLRHEI